MSDHLVPVLHAEPNGGRCRLRLECGHSTTVATTFNAAGELEMPTAVPCLRCEPNPDSEERHG